MLGNQQQAAVQEQAAPVHVASTMPRLKQQVLVQTAESLAALSLASPSTQAQAPTTELSTTLPSSDSAILHDAEDEEEAVAASASSSVPAPALSCQEVAWMFVEQYYTCMNQQPHRLYRFYHDMSQLTVGQEGEEVMTVEGKYAIKEKLLELEFTDCHVFVRNVDSQTSGPDGGIIVYVSGVLVSTGEGEGAATATEGARRKFSQTFFLAPQPRGYYVLNDILRFAEEAGVAAVAEEAVAAVVEEVATAVETRVVEEIVEKATVVEASATQPIAAEKTEVVAPATPVETKKEDVAKEVCKKEAATALTPAATTADAPKKSWASLAVNGSERWADNKLAAAAKAKASAAAAAKPVAIVAPPSSSSSSSNGLSARPAMPQRRETLTVAKRVYSVEDYTNCAYVTGEFTMMHLDEMRALFSTCGKVHSVHIIPLKCAFVKFETADGLKAAMARPFTLKDGSPLTVDERRMPRQFANGPRSSRGGSGSGFGDRRMSRGGSRGGYRGMSSRPEAGNGSASGSASSAAAPLSKAATTTA